MQGAGSSDGLFLEVCRGMCLIACGGCAALYSWSRSVVKPCTSESLAPALVRTAMHSCGCAGFEAAPVLRTAHCNARAGWRDRSARCRWRILLARTAATADSLGARSCPRRRCEAACGLFAGVVAEAPAPATVGIRAGGTCRVPKPTASCSHEISTTAVRLALSSFYLRSESMPETCSKDAVRPFSLRLLAHDTRTGQMPNKCRQLSQVLSGPLTENISPISNVLIWLERVQAWFTVSALVRGSNSSCQFRPSRNARQFSTCGLRVSRSVPPEGFYLATCSLGGCDVKKSCIIVPCYFSQACAQSMGSMTNTQRPQAGERLHPSLGITSFCLSLSSEAPPEGLEIACRGQNERGGPQPVGGKGWCSRQPLISAAGGWLLGGGGGVDELCRQAEPPSWPLLPHEYCSTPWWVGGSTGCPWEFAFSKGCCFNRWGTGTKRVCRALLSQRCSRVVTAEVCHSRWAPNHRAQHDGLKEVLCARPSSLLVHPRAAIVVPAVCGIDPSHTTVASLLPSRPLGSCVQAPTGTFSRIDRMVRCEGGPLSRSAWGACASPNAGSLVCDVLGAWFGEAQAA